MLHGSGWSGTKSNSRKLYAPRLRGRPRAARATGTGTGPGTGTGFLEGSFKRDVHRRYRHRKA